ncbi:MAG: acyl-CoA synthetase [Gammaproteobacteria bacterium]|nr:acyl-CoA synthetase [Gammaproteobacteria bacterium]
MPDHRLLDSALTDFDAVCRQFNWNIPKRFNIAHAVCDKHTDRFDQIALYYENEQGLTRQFTFGQLTALSNQLANALAAKGVGRGNRVAIILPQRPETAIAHLAAYKLGAIALPLSVLFGPDALQFRLQDSGSKVVIADSTRQEILESLRDELPELETIINCDTQDKSSFWGLVKNAGDDFDIVDTSADDAALLIYTSGTTGPPKGAVVAHRCLLGNLPGFELSHDFFSHENDLFWTPADWAWTGGLIDALLPSWYYGVPVLGYEGGKFDPEKACLLMEKYKVRNAFIPPTALKMIRQVGNIRGKYNLNMRSIMSAGEMVGAELFEWGRQALDVEINEMWAQTEFNYIVGNCAAIMPVKPGSMGKTYAGHRVAPVDEDGNELPIGESGELAAHRDDPVMFLGYWNREEATKAKFIGDWWGTGDVGYRDQDGYLWFVGRKDDVISSAGYRIGPGEIEDCLLKHPAVAQAAVIGKPDELRGEAIKAFIVLAQDHEANQALEDEIRSSVKNRLAAYEYPREIEFINELPLTTTGKVRRLELRQRELQKASY